MEYKDNFWLSFFGSIMIPASFVAGLLTDNPIARLFIVVIGIISWIVLITSEKIKKESKE